MLRRLTLILVGLSVAAAVSACNTNVNSLNNGVGVGPNFPANSIYAALSAQNTIDIWPSPAASGAAAPYSITGSNTTLDGPQYLAFDSGSNLWVTNYDSGTTASKILEFKTLASGSVFPLNTITYGYLGIPRGIAINNGTTTSTAGAPTIAVASSVAAAVLPALPDQIQFYLTTNTSGTAPYLVITGSSTGLNVPTGVAYNTTDTNLYVANRQSASVEAFAVPTPSPTPAPTATPAPTPTPSTSPSPTPTPTPANLLNLAPSAIISGSNTGLGTPTGVTLDASNVIYVVDPTSPLFGPSVIVFAANSTGNATPARHISGAATLLSLPYDVKVDTNGLIYVADAGAGKILIFASSASGNVAPLLTLPATTSIMGLGLSP